jgi:23S rRNA pseudouridine1911/1915/1917 synthase
VWNTGAVTERRWTVSAAEAGVRLDRFLAAGERLRSRSRAAAAIDRGKVFVNGAEAGSGQAGRALSAGDLVDVWMDRPGSGRAVRPRRRRDGELVIAYEDASLLVADKPAGLLAVPLRGRAERASLVDLVEAHLTSHGKRSPHVVHRIDRDTSGLVLFAKDGGALAHLKRQFLQRSPDRVYLAIVHGCPAPPEDTWRDRLVWDGEALAQRLAVRHDPRAREAISAYRLLRPLGGAALLEIRLVTGKRNQIRVQAALRGHPLVGERQYATITPAARIEFPRQALHAHRLGFDHPVTGRRVECVSPLPDDMAALVERLGVTGGNRPHAAP